MPNRRSPGKSPTQGDQVRADRAAPGMLHGASPVPAVPKKEQIRWRPHPIGRIRFVKQEVLWEDAGNGFAVVALDGLPMESSVEVYLCRPDFGSPLFEKLGWRWGSDEKTLLILPQSGAGRGDYIVVHYTVQTG